MEQSILKLLEQYPHLAILISLATSILVAVAGVVPSVFITATNILFFGFWNGTLLSFLGESTGAAIAFLLYRSGFKKNTSSKINRYPTLKRLINAEGAKAFYLIFSLRLLPFVPSGLITFAAAIGNVTLAVFITASSLGKIPALLIEAYTVYEVTNVGWQGKLILTITGLVLVGIFVIKKNNAIQQ